LIMEAAGVRWRGHVIEWAVCVWGGRVEGGRGGLWVDEMVVGVCGLRNEAAFLLYGFVPKECCYRVFIERAGSS